MAWSAVKQELRRAWPPPRGWLSILKATSSGSGACSLKGSRQRACLRQPKRGVPRSLWPPIALSTDLVGALGVDAAGNATVVYTARPTAGSPAMLRSMQYLRSTDAWSGVADIAASPLSGSGRVAVDSAGNATATWHGQDHTLRTARRPVGGQWSADATVGGLPGSPRIASDAVGNVFLLWGRFERPWALRAARWSATLGAPTIGRVISSSACAEHRLRAPASARSVGTRC